MIFEFYLSRSVHKEISIDQDIGETMTIIMTWIKKASIVSLDTGDNIIMMETP